MLAITPPATAAGLDDRLAVAGLSVAYRGVPALEDITWTAPASGLTAIVGPNGAGKSTLLKAILGLVASTGSATIGGRPVAERRDTTAYVPQRASVDWDFPATALDVVLQGMVREAGWLRGYGRARRDRAMALLDRVGLADLASRQIGQMSVASSSASSSPAALPATPASSSSTSPSPAWTRRPSGSSSTSSTPSTARAASSSASTTISARWPSASPMSSF